MANSNPSPSTRFTPGNKAATGNPHGGKISKLRAAMMDAVSEGDIYDIITKLVEQAKEGDVQSAREVIDRTIGKPQGNDTLNITSDAEQSNPFIDYIHRKPELARELSAFYRRMASDASNDGAPHQQGQVDVAGPSGPAIEQAARSGDDAE